MMYLLIELYHEYLLMELYYDTCYTMMYLPTAPLCYLNIISSFCTILLAVPKYPNDGVLLIDVQVCM